MRQGETKTTSSVDLNDFTCPLDCNHTFSIRPLKTSLYFHEKTSVSCCPEYSKKNQAFQNVWPQAFFDDKPHLPLFMLPVDRESTIKREKQYLESHKTKIKNLEVSQKQIFVPHPGKQKVTCFVCKTHYTDYRKHIQTKSHKKKLNSSKIEPSIRELIGLVSRSQSQYREQISTTCNQEVSRIMSLQVEKISPIHYIKPTKRYLKQAKLNHKKAEKIHAFSYDEVGLGEMNNIETKEVGQKKRDDFRGGSNNLISTHSFRVSDYLI